MSVSAAHGDRRAATLARRDGSPPLSFRSYNRGMDRRSLLLRIVAVAAFALIGVTSKLWTPQTVYPQVPLFAWAAAVPLWLEWTAAGVMVLALAGMLVLSPEHWFGRTALFGYAAATVFLVLVDQHRLQPWAYEFVLIALVLALAGPRLAMPLVQVLVISIYVHSALSKLDVSFLDSYGQQLLLGTLERLGIDIKFWSPTARRAAAATLPVGELLVAAGLIFRRTRLPAVCGSIAMHAGLLVALGPWGLDHKPGVLIWNVYFVAQNIVLFGGRLRVPAEVTGPGVATPRHRLGGVAATALTVLAAVLPFLEPFGLFDHWPAWAVYASRPGRVGVFVSPHGRARLPAELHPYLGPPRWSDGWSHVRIDRWSLETLDAPIYPQDRFRMGVALALAKRYDLSDEIRVETESSADRWTGERSRRELQGTEEIEREARKYFLNALPRGRFDQPQ